MGKTLDRTSAEMWREVVRTQPCFEGRADSTPCQWEVGATKEKEDCRMIIRF